MAAAATIHAPPTAPSYCMQNEILAVRTNIFFSFPHEDIYQAGDDRKPRNDESTSVRTWFQQAQPNRNHCRGISSKIKSEIGNHFSCWHLHWKGFTIPGSRSHTRMRPRRHCFLSHAGQQRVFCQGISWQKPFSSPCMCTLCSSVWNCVQGFIEDTNLRMLKCWQDTASVHVCSLLSLLFPSQRVC